MSDDGIWDVIVVGGGIGGMVSAMAAAQASTAVLLVETAEHLGGTFWYSGGGISVLSYEELRERIPDGDPGLQAALASDIRPGLDWLQSLHLPIARIPGGNGAIATYPPGFTSIIERRIRDAGGTIQLSTKVLAAERAAWGWNLSVQTADGSQQPLRSRTLILATGGFQNDSELVRQHLELDSSNMWARNSGLSSGTGLKIALANGGTLSAGMNTFYGHNLPAPPAKFQLEELHAVSQSYGAYTPALNIHGRRYCDEALTPPPAEETLAQDTARQPGGLAFYFFDEAIHQQHVSRRSYFYTGMPVQEEPNKLKSAREAGGRTWQADTLEELISEMADVFTSKEVALATLREYNEAAAQGRTRELSIPKRRTEYAIPLTQPPFYAVAVKAGITFTMGGIRVDSRARVVRDDGQPVEGLYAAGVDIGNAFNRFYAGGNALGLVFGRIAAAEAAEFARTAAVN
jgi:2-polyprenyl-6-methoxyphenol hydroxylase-like FAD-dependent oxidoreductase